MKTVKFGLVILFILMFSVPAGAGEYLSYTESEAEYNIQAAGLRISLPLGETRNSVYCNGRLCVSVADGVRLMGGELTQMGMMFKIDIEGKSVFLGYSDGRNRPVVFLYNNIPFVSLYELITPFDYEMLVDLETNFCRVVKYDSNVQVNAPNSGSSAAYIRLEDITADGLKPGGNGNYTVDMLEKLKYTAEYLYLSGQQYYIAWIPLYVCPEEDYSNDVSSEYNLYNSYFIYVLDYMTDHNGHLGLHGCSHQYGNEESGVGNEWGSATPYTYIEQQERMIKAKEACHRLGYTEEFFEFPHYAATDEQLLMAENYFDVIYQSFSGAYAAYHITYTERSGKRVYYVPTPADYVHYINDDSIYGKIDTCVNNGYELSLYFHPVIDKGFITVEESGGRRIWSYTEGAALPSVLKKVLDLNYSFSAFN